MKSFNQAEEKEEFIRRINKLTQSSKANWGKMNVQQMLNHLNDLFQTATETKVGKDSINGELFSFFGGGIFM